MSDRRQKWWNSLGFESRFKKRQLARILAFALAYVAISTACMGVAYSTMIGPLARAEMPFPLKLEILRDTGGIPGLSEMILIWATMMISLSVVFAVVVGLHFSHKLAGPLYRFKLELRRVAAGERVPPISLRAGDDDFQDIADALNAALERMQGEEGGLHQQLEDAEVRLEELRQGVLRHLDDPEALRRLVEKASQPG
jgi:methyl-accepting chemotaxis protein